MDIIISVLVSAMFLGGNAALLPSKHDIDCSKAQTYEHLHAYCTHGVQPPSSVVNRKLVGDCSPAGKQWLNVATQLCK